MADLLINGLDARARYGLRMGDSFLDALGQPPEPKEYITNDSPLEDGVQYIIPDDGVRLTARSVTLTFRLSGATHEAYLANKAAFFAVLRAGAITLQVPADSPAVYKLIYTKSTSYAQDVARTSCTVAVQFTEPNPADRT